MPLGRVRGKWKIVSSSRATMRAKIEQIKNISRLKISDEFHRLRDKHQKQNARIHPIELLLFKRYTVRALYCVLLWKFNWLSIYFMLSCFWVDRRDVGRQNFLWETVFRRQTSKQSKNKNITLRLQYVQYTWTFHFSTNKSLFVHYIFNKRSASVRWMSDNKVSVYERAGATVPFAAQHYWAWYWSSSMTRCRIILSNHKYWSHIFFIVFTDWKYGYTENVEISRWVYFYIFTFICVCRLDTNEL